MKLREWIIWANGGNPWRTHRVRVQAATRQRALKLGNQQLSKIHRNRDCLRCYEILKSGITKLRRPYK